MEIDTKELRKHITYIRPEVPSDDYVIPLILRFYKNLPYHEQIVMDLGGCTGAFAVYAALRGARKVISYEPEEGNFAALLVNTQKYDQVVPIKAAVTMSKDPEISFYLTTGASTDGYSTLEFRGRDKITVHNLYFPDELERHRPTSIKMNIEGGEYELMKHPLPDFVRAVVMDIHFSKKRFREQFNELIAPFEGWRAIIQPKNTGKNFHTKGLWVR